MKTYGTPVTLATEKVSEDYELQHGEKAKIVRQEKGELYAFGEFNAEKIETDVLNKLISEFIEKPEVELLYAQVKAERGIPLVHTGVAKITVEVHIQSNHPFGISMAVAIVVLCIGVAFAVWIGVLVYGTYRFIEEFGGWAGGIGMGLVFILVIVFILLLLGGKLAIGGEKGLKIGK